MARGALSSCWKRRYSSQEKSRGYMELSCIEQAMRQAITLAKEAFARGNYPIGSLVVRSDGAILSSLGSGLIGSFDPTAHPEVSVIRQAAAQARAAYLKDCWLVSTLEPCPMCTSAAIWAKMAGIAYGTAQDTARAFGKRYGGERFSFRQINIRCRDVLAAGDPLLALYEGVLQSECDALLELARSPEA